MANLIGMILFDILLDHVILFLYAYLSKYISDHVLL